MARRRRAAVRDVRPLPVVASAGLLPVLPSGDRRIVRIRPRQMHALIPRRGRQPRRLRGRRRRRRRRFVRSGAVARRVHGPDPERMLRPVRQTRHRMARRRRAAVRDGRPLPVAAPADLLPVLPLRDRRIARSRPCQMHAPVPRRGRQPRRLRGRRHRRRRRLVRFRACAERIQRPHLERMGHPVRQARHRMARRRRAAVRDVRPASVISSSDLLAVLPLRDELVVRVRPRQVSPPVPRRSRQPGRLRRLRGRPRRRRRDLVRPLAVAGRIHRPDPEPVLRFVLQPCHRVARRRRAAARHRRPVPELPLPFLLPVLVLGD